MKRLDDTTQDFVYDYAMRAGLTKDQIRRARAVGLKMRELERKIGRQVKLTESTIKKILEP